MNSDNVERDKNGYDVEYIRSLPVFWKLFYGITGLLPFSISKFVVDVIFHPISSFQYIAWAIRWRIARRMKRWKL